MKILSSYRLSEPTTSCLFTSLHKIAPRFHGRLRGMISQNHMFGFHKKEIAIIKKLNTPHKIQNFLEIIPENMEENGETCFSPRRVLREKKAHCIEGALFAAMALWYHGRPPLLLDFWAKKYDDDHVVALFQEKSHWGAISKTNHVMLRYRDPVFRTIRELALSYFNEYFSLAGRKSLYAYSARPLNLKKLGTGWITSEKPLWHICDALNVLPHKNIIPKGIKVRPLDQIELKAGKLVQWKKI